MKIINATWEKRNLGCDAYEIQIERKDLKNFSSIMSELKKQDFSGAYVTVKMPVGNLEALHALEDDGFRFMEVSFQIEKDINAFTVSSIYRRMLNTIDFIEISKDENWDDIIDTYLTDEMFTSDRIYLDYALSKGTSALRYKNWSKDLKNSKTSVMVCFLSKKNLQKLGFAIFDVDKRQGLYRAILGGTFPSNEVVGIGGAVLCSHFEYVRKSGGKKFETHISSNNLPIVRLYSYLGNIITDEHYVMRKFF